MNKDLCAKIWTVLGAAASLTALNVFVQSQGGLLFTGGYLIEKRPVIASFDAILIVSALLIVVCLVGVQYARLSSSDAWSTRLPIVGDDGKSPVEAASWSLRFYQAFFVLAYVTRSGLLGHPFQRQGVERRRRVERCSRKRYERDTREVHYDRRAR